MATTQTAAAQAPAVDEAAQEEMRRLLLEAPIAELAENQGISIDEAVALRVEQAVAGFGWTILRYSTGTRACSSARPA